MTPGFAAYPGTVSLRMSTYVALIEDMLEGFYRSGFRRIVLVNGHGGNSPVMTFCTEWMGTAPRCQRQAAQLVGRAALPGGGEGDRPGRLACLLDGELPLDPARGRRTCRTRSKPPFDRGALPGRRTRRKKREILGDGNFHGRYQRSDNEMLSLWQVGVEETRAAMTENWP